MHISHTCLTSQEVNSKNDPESLILLMSHKILNTQHFFLLHDPIYSLNNLYDLCCSMSTHSQPLFIYQSNFCQK